MKAFTSEVDSNFINFFSSFEKNLNLTVSKINRSQTAFNRSYRRLVSLQAWRSELIEKQANLESAEFFKEAQNDALMSHALARQGAWRLALISLRSSIENVLYYLYYRDHPVELELWSLGEHRLGFTETTAYLCKHPIFRNLKASETGIEGIKQEYATLSKAVHASSKLFRVTKDGEIAGLNVNSKAQLGGWGSRETKCLLYLNLILLTFFRDQLQGAANINLRKAISLAIPSSKHKNIRDKLGITLKTLKA